uniref:hypothetical protein n=1 Tax=Falsiroseomonas oryzae TaxID=2766473 RepID=UPI0022EAC00D
AELARLWPRLAASPPPEAEAMALAARDARIGLLLDAVARRHGLDGNEPSPSAELLRERAIAFLLARAQVVQREVGIAELEQAARP